MKRFYSALDQIGKSCGIYSLEIVNGIINNIPVNTHSYYETIEKCIKKSFTKIGEVFDINMLNTIANEFYPNIKTEVRQLKSVSDIDIFLNNYVLIMPIMNTVPHYIVLYKDKNKIVHAYNYTIKLFSCRINLKKIYKKNYMIPNNFIWTANIVHENSIKISTNRILLYIHDRQVSSYYAKYYQNIYKNAVEKNIINVGDIDKVDMCGKCLIVSPP